MIDRELLQSREEPAGVLTREPRERRAGKRDREAVRRMIGLHEARLKRMEAERDDNGACTGD